MPDWNIIAVNLYDGTTTTTRREEAAQLMQNLSPQRAEVIIAGVQKKIGKNAKVATPGWCMGSGWSLQAAIAAPQYCRVCDVLWLSQKRCNQTENVEQQCGIYKCNTR